MPALLTELKARTGTGPMEQVHRIFLASPGKIDLLPHLRKKYGVLFLSSRGGGIFRRLFLSIFSGSHFEKSLGERKLFLRFLLLLSSGLVQSPIGKGVRPGIPLPGNPEKFQIPPLGEFPSLPPEKFQMGLPNLPLSLHLGDHELAVPVNPHVPEISPANLSQQKEKPLVFRLVVGTGTEITTCLPENIFILLLQKGPRAGLSGISPGGPVKKTANHAIAPSK